MWGTKRSLSVGNWTPPLRIVIERYNLDRRSLAVVVVAGLALLAYLGAARWAGGPGFPLDDAWIHQTYARNLATTGQWAYRPGQISAGSTSPLWTVLLSIGYWLGLNFRLWTYLLGFLALLATAWEVYRLGQRLFSDRPAIAFLAALSVAIEWHLVWAAASGMETLLFTALSLTLLDAFLAGADHLRSWFGIGLLGGLLTLTRPEGMVLLALVGLARLMADRWQKTEGKGRTPMAAPFASLRAGSSFFFRWAIVVGLGFALLIVPYLAFNRVSGAGWLPNTFYAKQQEYAVLLAEPYLLRLARLVGTTWVGPQVLLVPGFAWMVWRTLSSFPSPTRGGGRGEGFTWLPLAWWATFLALYAWRLPVTYQHGRYLIPSIPILLLYGVAGTTALIRPASPRLWTRLVGRTAIGALVVVALVFLGRGGWAYAVDVQIVNTEMVAAGLWLRDHAPAAALVAAHDIGAIGYYADQPLVDLAGLVTPEVIPFLRDESHLLAYMQSRKAAYFVTFPGWYPQLSADPCFTPVYQGNAPWSPQAGGEHMVIYQTCWR